MLDIQLSGLQEVYYQCLRDYDPSRHASEPSGYARDETRGAFWGIDTGQSCKIWHEVEDGKENNPRWTGLDWHCQFSRWLCDRSHRDLSWLAMSIHERFLVSRMWTLSEDEETSPETIIFLAAGLAGQVVGLDCSCSNRHWQDGPQIDRTQGNSATLAMDMDRVYHRDQVEHVAQAPRASFSRKIYHSISTTRNIGVNNSRGEQLTCLKLTSTRWSSSSQCFNVKQAWQYRRRPWAQSRHLKSAAVSEHEAHESPLVDGPIPSRRRSSSSVESRSVSHWTSFDCSRWDVSTLAFYEQ